MALKRFENVLLWRYTNGRQGPFIMVWEISVHCGLQFQEAGGVGYNLGFFCTSLLWLCEHWIQAHTIKEAKCLLNLSLAQHVGEKRLGNNSLSLLTTFVQLTQQ